MNFLFATAGPVAPVFAHGFVLGLGLIVAIGAQNAFVLRQGLRREHVGAVVAFCALMDAALITAGVFGMARALGDRPQLARALALAGAAFLAWYGWKAFQRMRHAGSLQAATGGEALSRRAALAGPPPSRCSTPMCTWTRCCWWAAWARSNRRRCRPGLPPAPAPPAWSGSACSAWAPAGWRRGSPGPPPGACWTDSLA